MRLVYLDEAGTDYKAPVLAVAGVLVHGDLEWPEIDRRVCALIDKFIPEADRSEFIFHAKDIFHGSGYFDRRKPQWDHLDKRILVLNELADIIDDLHLPIVLGHYVKDKFGAGVLTAEDGPKKRGLMIHGSAAMDCLVWADKWLAEYAPSELATVVHEGGAATSALIKRAVRVLRHPGLMTKAGMSGMDQQELSLPLKRIIDTVHFADKADARPLQLADLCAFVLGRALKDMPIPSRAFRIIWKHLKWRQRFKAIAPASSERHPS